jgi:hypothetical protein
LITCCYQRWPRPGSRDGGSRPIQPRRAARAAPLQAAAAGGAARRWADTHRRPVSTSYSPQNRPRPPSTASAAPARSIHKLTGQVLPCFVHRIARIDLFQHANPRPRQVRAGHRPDCWPCACCWRSLPGLRVPPAHPAGPRAFWMVTSGSALGGCGPWEGAMRARGGWALQCGEQPSG